MLLSSFLGGVDTVDIVSEAKASTRPLDLILCLDASRSMNRVSTAEKAFPPGGTSIHEKPLPGSRWSELTDTVALFLDAMRDINPNARIGLVTFGGGASTERILGTGVESPLDLDLARLEQSLTLVISNEAGAIPATLQSYVDDNPALGLGTSLYEGLQVSLGTFDNNNNSSKHIVMLSDGAQAAVPSPEPILAAEDAADANVTVHTIAFGTGVDVLGDIAKETGGSTFSALGEDELREAFASLLARFRTKLVD